ncbi:galactose-1-phosphate uridylyltransferase [Stackebrandtia soli]|uniref:galactose-1-phosphate uridylyltransferase n=1 Tax=Stackebrandtia soli TaxID=1892856 RepID=UPI0039ED4EB6
MTHVARARLSDGREIVYFDATDEGRDRHRDARPAEARAGAAELRRDVTTGEWVSVAANRQSRPFLPAATDCPLCPSSDGRTTEIPAPDYAVAVFENRFPSFGGPPESESIMDDSRRPSVGRCEVVCYTSDHGESFSGLDPDRVRLVMDAWAHRTAELSRDPNVEQVFPFENRGEEIGVTLHHPHGQIYGYPYVAPTTRRMLDVAREHRAATGRDLFADVLESERAGERVIAANEHWTAFVPVAARWPFEVHVYPHVQVPDLAALPERHRDAFGPLYLSVLRALDNVFEVPMPYVSGWYQAPVRTDRDLAYLHLRLFSVRRAPGKLKYVAGSESAQGAFVNDVPPERAARLLREAM